MSIRIFGKLQNYSKNHYQHPQRILVIAQQKLKEHRNSSNRNNENKIKIPQDLTNGSRIGQTTILVQQGCDIQELPVILRKMQSDEIAVICPNVAENHKIQVNMQNHQLNFINQSEILPDLVIQQLDYCVTSTGILSIIDQISDEKLTAEIAAHAFDRLIRNETLVSLKNLEDSSPVFEKLIRCILKNCDPKVLLDFMEILKTFLDLQKTVQRFCDELLLRNSDGMLNCIEICECIERFADCKQFDGAEKFWTGIADQEKSIDANNIKFIFKTLPKLKISKRLVYGVLERQTPKIWWNLQVPALVECIEALVQANCAPVRTLQSFARWLNTNIHAVNEFQLETIVRSMTKLDYSNSEIEKALERYIKAKGIKIKSSALISGILEHCIRFRLRNLIILNGASEYFIQNSNKIHPQQMCTIIQCFGYLDVQPNSAVKFWKITENYLRQNFSKITPQDIIEICLNCCYLEIFPLNFVSSIFNPHFLDLVNTTTNSDFLPKIRTDLKLLDTTLSLEAETYTGPMLPKDHSAKSIWQDGRIKRMMNSISELLEKLSGGSTQFSKDVIIGKLPTNTLYIIDALIHPPGFKTYFSFKNDRNILVAILIMIPDYYDSKHENLIGPQKMRIRHFRKIGMKVVTLDYDILAKYKFYPVQLEKYIVQQMKQALQALPEN